MRALGLLLLALVFTGCTCAEPTPIRDAGSDAAAVIDTGVSDAGTDAPDAFVPSDTPRETATCLATHAAGDRYATGDGCNFCECAAGGVETCTTRTCVVSDMGCTYDGDDHGYGDRFPSTDGCNQCVCAASGLACTRRTTCPGGIEEGAILVEDLDEPCGDDPTFTAQSVLDGLPTTDFRAPFLYERTRTGYPETLTDTFVRFRIVRDTQDFVVCRLPSIDQPAFDMQITIEWITDDGAFDEGLPAYLRRNGFGFVDAWLIQGATVPLGGLSGTYSPNCSLDPGPYSFDAQIEPDGHSSGSVYRVCETDLSLLIGAFDRAAP